jgi:hypothetical protein
MVARLTWSLLFFIGIVEPPNRLLIRGSGVRVIRGVLEDQGLAEMQTIFFCSKGHWRDIASCISFYTSLPHEAPILS